MQVSADSADQRAAPATPGAGRSTADPLAYRALVGLNQQYLNVDGKVWHLAPGMQVSAEIHLGTRTVLEYLLSPLSKAFHEAGRER